MTHYSQSDLNTLDQELRVYSEYQGMLDNEQNSVSNGWDLNTLTAFGIHQTQSRAPRRQRNT